MSNKRLGRNPFEKKLQQQPAAADGAQPKKVVSTSAAGFPFSKTVKVPTESRLASLAEWALIDVPAEVAVLGIKTFLLARAVLQQPEK